MCIRDRIKYGTTNATADIKMYGITSMAYFVDLSLPNILTIINTTMKMMIGQIIALVIATYFVRPNFHASESVIPAALNSLATMLNAVFVGVPTAPYGTGVLFMINAHIAAQSGGKPKPINSGADVYKRQNIQCSVNDF